MTAQKQEKTRYSREELEEFRQIILQKLEEAREEYEYLRRRMQTPSENDVLDTIHQARPIEDSYLQMEREYLAQLADRLYRFIQKLEQALVRIDNGTYGICRITGKLIPKERLRVVPHTTVSIEAKRRLRH